LLQDFLVDVYWLDCGDDDAVLLTVGVLLVLLLAWWALVAIELAE
jgi:hypothetical protein